MVVKVHVFSLFVMFVLINSSFLLHHNRDGYLKITDFGFAKIVTYKVSPLSLLVLSLRSNTHNTLRRRTLYVVRLST